MKQRIITGLILLPLLILFIAQAPLAGFHGLVCLVTFLALREFYAMTLPSGRKVEGVAGCVAGVLLVLPLGLGYPSLFIALLACAVLGFGVWFLMRFGEIEKVVSETALLFFGFLYLPLLLGHMTLLRSVEHGRSWIFFVLLVIMACDSMAYFVGMSIGRRRLYPAISPKKSIEGSLGGLAGGVAGALIAHATFFPELPVVHCLSLGVLLGVLGQVGDLFESMIKRGCGVKDSGTLIPGHGGIVDRLDSLLFVFAPAYYYALWFGA